MTDKPSDEMGRFGFDGAEGFAFWIYADASQEEALTAIRFDELPVLGAFLRHNLPGLFNAPPTDDEREALFGLIYRYETIDFAESQNFTTRDCHGVVETILASGFRQRGPVTNTEVEAVANIMAESEDTGSLETARAALEAARAVE